MTVKNLQGTNAAMDERIGWWWELVSVGPCWPKWSHIIVFTIYEYNLLIVWCQGLRSSIRSVRICFKTFIQLKFSPLILNPDAKRGMLFVWNRQTRQRSLVKAKENYFKARERKALSNFFQILHNLFFFPKIVLILAATTLYNLFCSWLPNSFSCWIHLIRMTMLCGLSY